MGIADLNKSRYCISAKVNGEYKFAGYYDSEFPGWVNEGNEVLFVSEKLACGWMQQHLKSLLVEGLDKESISLRRLSYTMVRPINIVDTNVTPDKLKIANQKVVNK